MASYASPTRSSQFKSRLPSNKTSYVRLSTPDRPRTPDYTNPHANSARKRSRFEPADGLSPRHSPAPAAYPTLHPATRSHVAPSPPPLANARYRLAAGLDSSSASGYQTSPFYAQPDADFRKRWSSTPIVERIDPGLLTREGNGTKRAHTQTQSDTEMMREESWRAFVLRMAGRVAGGVAGKVWEFAAGGFKGFRAGGGTSYQMTDAGLRPFDDSDPWLRIQPDEKDEELPPPLPPRTASPLPGAFPAEDERPKKRLQTSQGTDWVIVDQVDNQSTQSFSPRASSYATSRSITASSYRNHTPRLSGPRSQASVSRRPRVGIPRAASVAGTGSPRSTQPAHSASFAQQRSPHHSPHRPSVTTPTDQRAQQSPQQRDIERWSAKRDREQRQADASMHRLNKQLQDMIKQGKAALETKYEVMEDDDYTSDYPAIDEEKFGHTLVGAIPNSAASPRARW